MTESAPNPIRATLPARMPRVTPMIASSDVQAMLKYSTRRPARVQRTRSGSAAFIATSGITVLTILRLSYRTGLKKFHAKHSRRRGEDRRTDRSHDHLQNNDIPSKRLGSILRHSHFHRVESGRIRKQI